ncbi:MAG: septal ring lytic transglycosylase RlpA family protein [Syntrophobacteraceae bacterium]|jgi:rare lipoprotein A|nr:septal ring lytic transglycosylase RlpA family protein [Syntrophobacteraceae bacterium]
MAIQRLRGTLGAGVLACLFLAGCASEPTQPPASYSTKGQLRSQRPYQVKGTWYYPIPSAAGYVEEGLASWYGADFHGKPTSCGEPYDMWAMTAAHKTLPLGTHVKVTSLQTGNSIIVRVNDRGPFVSGRIIDLSCRASQELGSFKTGLARVRVEAVQVATQQLVGRSTYWKVDPVPSFRYGSFTIQVGAFREQQNALRLKSQMAQGYSPIQVSPSAYGGTTLYRVQVGAYQDLVLAQQELERLRNRGFGDAFVVAMEVR